MKIGFTFLGLVLPAWPVAGYSLLCLFGGGPPIGYIPIALALLLIMMSAFDIIHHYLTLVATLIVIGYSVASQFHRFRDSGESGPLPYEWLNDYWIISWPAVLVGAYFTWSLWPRKPEQVVAP